jgi:hypothetical protein
MIEIKLVAGHSKNFQTPVGISTLSRAQAQIAFVEGKKISHKYFLDGEFIKLNVDNKMEDENGLILNKINFWLARGTKQFDDGWFIVE